MNIKSFSNFFWNYTACKITAQHSKSILDYNENWLYRQKSPCRGDKADKKWETKDKFFKSKLLFGPIWTVDLHAPDMGVTPGHTWRLGRWAWTQLKISYKMTQDFI